MVIIAVIIASALLVMTTAITGENLGAVTIMVRGIGFIGFFVSLFFAQRLFRDMMNGK